DAGLVVGMPVQARPDALPRRTLEDDRDARPEEVALEVAALELALLDDPNRHVVVPLAGDAAASSAPPVGARDTRRARGPQLELAVGNRLPAHFAHAEGAVVHARLGGIQLRQLGEVVGARALRLLPLEGEGEALRVVLLVDPVAAGRAHGEIGRAHV